MPRAASPPHRVVLRVLGLALATTVLTAAGAAAGLALGVDRPDRWALARTTGFLLPLVVLRRRRGARTEEAFQRNLAHAGLVLATGSAVDLVVRLAVPAAAGVVFGASVLVACALSYRGLLLWNRIETGAAARTDWLNGAAAVLAGAALANLLVAVLTDGSLPRPGVHLQLVLLGWSALLVLVGATFVIAVANGSLGDPRPWALGCSLALVAVLRSVGVVEALAGAVLPKAEVGWVLVALAMAACTLLPRREVPSRVPPVSGLFLSSVTVAVVAVLTLVAATRADPARNGGAVLPAVLALGLVGTRVGHLVGALSSLPRARQEARTDDLTGLTNRRGLLAAIARESVAGGPLALAVVDLTRFREVLDRHGHATGDDVLRALAPALRGAAPEGAVTARLSTAQLAVLFTGGQPLAVAGHVVQGLRTAVVDGRTFDVGPAAGVAEGSLDALELLRRAHVAVHRAQAGGVVAYDDDSDRAEHGRAQLVEELLAAFGPQAGPASRDGFEVHYQPQVAADGEVTGVEALARWRHPRLGLLTPTSFLPLVEGRDLMRGFTAHVARRAAADLLDWHRQGLDLTLSVNASTSCLGSPFLLPLLDEIIAGGVRGDRLVVEVTETTLMADPSRALAVCRDITARGCGLSIDDYGTGYSSLAYLADLPATELKIDRTFTARLLGDERIAAIVAGTVELAHQLGLRAVAEGVEDSATLRRLDALGCDASQGYLHTAALPAHRVGPWLAGRRVPRSRLAPPLTRD